MSLLTRAFVTAGITIACGTVAGCKAKARGPDVVLRAYTDAAIHGRAKEAWPLLCARDRAFKSEAAMEAEAASFAQPNAQAVIAKTTLAFGPLAIDGDRATIEQRITAPDLEAIVAQAQSDPAIVAKVRSLPADQARAFGQDLLAAALAKPGCPMKTTTETMTLVRESGHWKVVADFEGHAAKERHRALQQDMLRGLSGNSN